MAEETTTGESETTTPQSDQQSLDDVYTQFAGVIQEPQPKEPATGPGVQPQPSGETPATPGDQTGGTAHQGDAALATRVARLEQENLEQRQELLRRESERELRQIVDEWAPDFEGLPSKKLLMLAIQNEYEQDTRFQAIANKRSSNPDAWEKVLGALKTRLQGELISKHSPQLAENQRALDRAQHAASESGVPEPDQTKENLDLERGQFQTEWQNLLDGKPSKLRTVSK